MSLLGMAIMAFAEISGSLLVIWRWQFASRNANESLIFQREIRAALAIGLMICALGVSLFFGSFAKTFNNESPDSEAAGLWIALFGVCTSFSLYIYKMIIGNQLQSLVVLADARVSLCVGLISVAVFVALALSDVLGWADGVMGMCVAIFTVQQGVTQVVEAREKMNGSFFSPASDGSMGKLPIHDESARLIPDPIRQAGGTGAAENFAPRVAPDNGKPFGTTTGGHGQTVKMKTTSRGTTRLTTDPAAADTGTPMSSLRGHRPTAGPGGEGKAADGENGGAAAAASGAEDEEDDDQVTI
mmetsp:Transcript_5000/g.10939  ORF Transcript_5000/g.10939 Transcript_5000/m.10939 type:complete len:300 (+) Transcript_5000:168-1067(+)